MTIFGKQKLIYNIPVVIMPDFQSKSKADIIHSSSDIYVDIYVITTNQKLVSYSVWLISLYTKHAYWNKEVFLPLCPLITLRVWSGWYSIDREVSSSSVAWAHKLSGCKFYKSKKELQKLARCIKFRRNNMAGVLIHLAIMCILYVNPIKYIYTYTLLKLI